jgi:hypothetical protein
VRESTHIVYRDFLTLLVMGMVVLALIAISHVVEKVEAKAAKEPLGNVMVQINWPAQDDSDVDLWVQAPGDVPVGYSNLNGRLFNLLRDDLGQHGDTTNMNQEDALSRGIAPGEYAVNIHLYSNSGGQLPIPVTARISSWSGQGRAVDLVNTTVNLTYVGQELTVLRFRLQADGTLVAGSEHHLFKPLRSAQK